MAIPQGYTLPTEFATYSTQIPLVCKLIKSLYSLHQSPREWFVKFITVLLGYGFKHASYYHILFIHATSISFMAILVYMLMISFLLAILYLLLVILKLILIASQFKIKDLGSVKYFLWIEAARSDKGIYQNQ